MQYVPSSLVARLLLVGLLAGSGCTIKREVITPTGNNFSAVITSTIPQTAIDKVRELGVTIYDGQEPTNLEGIFYITEFRMTKTSVPGENASIGNRFTDLKVRVYNQNGVKLTASLDEKTYNYNNGSVTSTSTGEVAYASGRGNNFTLFVVLNTQKISNTTRSKELTVISGQMTASGIQNLEYSLLMLDDYGDVNNDLIPVNSGRAFKDQDGFSERVSSFRIAAPDARLSATSSGEKPALMLGQDSR